MPPKVLCRWLGLQYITVRGRLGEIAPPTVFLGGHSMKHTINGLHDN